MTPKYIYNFYLLDEILHKSSIKEKEEVIIEELRKEVANKKIRELRNLKNSEEGGYEKFIGNVHFAEELSKWMDKCKSNTISEYTNEIKQLMPQRLKKQQEYKKQQELEKQQEQNNLKTILNKQKDIIMFKGNQYTHCIGVLEIYFFKFDYKGNIMYCYTNKKGYYDNPLEFQINDNKEFVDYIESSHKKYSKEYPQIIDDNKLTLIKGFIERDEVSIFEIPPHKHK
jgi:hypothetical protein